MNRCRRFLALPSPERRLRLEALSVMLRVRLRLSLRPIPAARAWMERRAASSPAAPPPAPSTPAEVDRAVRSAATFLPGATCLVRAMTGRILLGRRGVPCGVRLGLAKDGGGDLDAHAWIECADGTVVGDRGREDYAAVPL